MYPGHILYISPLCFIVQLSHITLSVCHSWKLIKNSSYSMNKSCPRISVYCNISLPSHFLSFKFPFCCFMFCSSWAPYDFLTESPVISSVMSLALLMPLISTTYTFIISNSFLCLRFMACIK